MTTWHRVSRYGNACAELVLDYHPLHLFDVRRKRKEERLVPPKPVVAVKARAAVAAKSRACDLRKPSVSEPIDTYNHERFIEQATVSAFEQDSQVRSRYWQLIDEFEMPTGVLVLLNTASDLRGEAIVHTFSSSGMGALVLGSLLVEK